MTPTLRKLVDALAQLPGVGERSAERIAFHLFRSPELARSMAEAITDLVTSTRECSVCFGLADCDPCAICSDPRRDRSLVCVVEETRDMLALEKAAGQALGGVYHVLQGRIAPLEGKGPEDLTLDALARRAASGEVSEVVIATNPDMEGDATALHIGRMLEGSGVKITRLARGLPSGSHIEFANQAILREAISGRQGMG